MKCFFLCLCICSGKYLKENLIYSSHIWIVFHVLWCYWIYLFLHLKTFKKWRPSKVLHGCFILQLWKSYCMFSWMLYFPPSLLALVNMEKNKLVQIIFSKDNISLKFSWVENRFLALPDLWDGWEFYMNVLTSTVQTFLC